MNLEGMRVLVIGLGKTGVDSIRFLASRGAKVRATDAKPISDLTDVINGLGSLAGKLEFSAYNADVLSRVDMGVDDLFKAFRRG